jgi:hypothetical protein
MLGGGGVGVSFSKRTERPAGGGRVVGAKVEGSRMRHFLVRGTTLMHPDDDRVEDDSLPRLRSVEKESRWPDDQR